MNWEEEQDHEARELNQYDHSLRHRCYLNNATSIGDIFETPETAEAFRASLENWRQGMRRLRRDLNRRCPIADRVSRGGFRIGDKVRIRGQRAVVTVCDVEIAHYPGERGSNVRVSGMPNTSKRSHFYDESFDDQFLEMVEPRKCRYDLRQIGDERGV